VAERADLSLELVQRIQNGDGAAWEELYLRYRDPLLLSIRSRLGQGLRARLTSEDILHSVVKDALTGLQEFEHRGPGSLAHFLHACVLNKIRNKADYHAAQKRAGDVALSATLLAAVPARGDDSLEYLDAERYGKLERALAQLAAEVREIVILRLVEGLSNREAAQVVGKSAAATTKAYCRGIARLGSLIAT